MSSFVYLNADDLQTELLPYKKDLSENNIGLWQELLWESDFSFYVKEAE